MPRPRLLISVRNATEAVDAHCAGADLIDVKEPHRGALGMADGATIRAILSAVGTSVPTSIALGELMDGNEVPEFDNSPSYAKFGLAGARNAVDWPAKLERAIRRLPGEVQPVAVAYADWREAESPTPQEVLQVAVELGCRGLLLDTYCKQGGSLTVRLSAAELRELVEGARNMKLITVLAGGLQTGDLEKLAPLEPDYFGFRGAVCRGGREAVLAPDLVRSLKRFLRAGEPEDPASLAQHHALRAG